MFARSPLPLRQRPPRLARCRSPRRAPAACAARRPSAAWSARRRCRPTTSSTRSSSARARACKQGDRVAARSVSLLRRRARARGRGDRQARHPGGDPVRPAREEGRGRQRGVAPGGRRPARDPRDQEGDARADGRRRRLLLRVHHARPLRRASTETARSTTTPRWRTWAARRCRTRAPAPTSSRRRA